MKLKDDEYFRFYILCLIISLVGFFFCFKALELGGLTFLFYPFLISFTLVAMLSLVIIVHIYVKYKSIYNQSKQDNKGEKCKL